MSGFIKSLQIVDGVSAAEIRFISSAFVLVTSGAYV